MFDAFERARGLVDVRFRAHGRNVQSGLDCVGVVLIAFKLNDLVIPPYRLTGGSWEQIESILSSAFDTSGDPEPAAEQLVISRLPRCFHMGVLGTASVVHADLRVGRVVETPGSLAGAIRHYHRF